MPPKLRRALVRAAKIALAIRVGYAVILFLGTLAYRLGLGNYIYIDHHLGVTLMQSPASFYLIWGLFVALYLAGAVLIIMGKRLGVLIYALAFATDFMLSTQWFLAPSMDRAYYGWAMFVENAINAFDLSVIAILLLALTQPPKPGPKSRWER